MWGGTQAIEHVGGGHSGQPASAPPSGTPESAGPPSGTPESSAPPSGTPESSTPPSGTPESAPPSGTPESSAAPSWIPDSGWCGVELQPSIERASPNEAPRMMIVFARVISLPSSQCRETHQSARHDRVGANKLRPVQRAPDRKPQGGVCAQLRHDRPRGRGAHPDLMAA